MRLAQVFPSLSDGWVWTDSSLVPWLARESPGSLLKMQILIEWIWERALRICVSNTFCDDASGAGPQATL